MTKQAKSKTAKPTSERVDVYQKVTDAIIRSLEAGVRPWTKPWDSKGGPTLSFAGGVRPLRWNGQRYTGINVVLLWAESAERGYQSPYWLTFNQARKLGKKVDGKIVPASVRKGEKAAFVVYFSPLKKPKLDASGNKVKNAQGEDVIVTVPLLKQYFVFNAEQIDGLPDRYYVAKEPEVPVEPTKEQVEEEKKARAERLIHADEFFRKVGAEIKFGGSRAFYSPAGDFIQLPPIEDFHDTEGFYSTLGHEAVHWTGHESRLNRQFDRFGSEAYAAEELVAELGAAFLSADLAITLEPRDDHAAYIGSWLKVLKGDKRFIVSAASQAQKAVGLLRELAGEPDEKFEEKEEDAAEAA